MSITIIIILILGAIFTILWPVIAVIGIYSRGGYRIENNRVVYRIPGIGVYEVPLADPTTFKTLKGQKSYGRDKANIYYRSDRIVNADLQTFGVIHGQYSKDKNHVYAGGKVIPKADPLTFKILSTASGVDYQIDAQSVYYRSGKIEGADPKSFTVLSANISKDNNHVYVCEKIIKGADSNSFETIQSTDTKAIYAKDNKRIYFTGQESENEFRELSTVDISSFVVLSGGYSRDLRTVFYQGKKIPHANALHFEILPGETYAKDDRHVYLCGKPLAGADAKSFTIIEKSGAWGLVAKDINHYYMGASRYHKTSSGSYEIDPQLTSKNGKG